MIDPDVNRNSSSCQQVIGDFQRILKAVSATSFQQLFENNFLRDKYLFQYCRERNFAAETQKKYLRTILDFLNFQISENVLEDITTDEAVRMQVLVKGWMKSKSRYSKVQRGEGMEKNFTNQVDNDQLQRYENSENAIMARNTFEKLQNGEKITINRGLYQHERPSVCPNSFWQWKRIGGNCQHDRSGIS